MNLARKPGAPLAAHDPVDQTLAALDAPGSPADGADRAATDPLGLTAGPGRRSVNEQAVLLAAALLVGGGMLYGMRYLGMRPSKAGAAEVKIDYDLAGAGKPKDAVKHETLLADLSANRSVIQVPSEKVQKNPFMMSAGTIAPAEGPLAAGDDSDAARRAQMDAESRRRQLDERRARIDSLLASTRLRSVISGPVPMARLGNRTVKVGDLVEDTFTVREIGAASVTLEADGRTFVLTMSEN